MYVCVYIYMYTHIVYPCLHNNVYDVYCAGAGAPACPMGPPAQDLPLPAAASVYL